MARPFIPSGPSIGQPPRTPREITAESKMLDAIAARGFDFTGFQPAPGGVVAVAINGEKVLMHLGRDKADAASRLATLALRPEGRGY